MSDALDDQKEKSLAEFEARLDRVSAPLRDGDPTRDGARSAGSGDAPPMELFRPFGPAIARFKAPPHIVDRLNGFIDRFVTDHGDPLHADGSGIVVGTFRVPPPVIVGPVGEYFEAAVQAYVRQCDRAAGEVRFENFWVVRQGAGTFSPVHFHSTDVAGVLYLKVPQVITEGKAPGNYITARRGGCITFLHGGRQSLSKSYVSFTPEVGDVLLSPAWLLHAVEPFDGPGERRSLAFNAALR